MPTVPNWLLARKRSYGMPDCRAMIRASNS